MSPEPLPALTLARILRPWGRRGEVAAEILTDFPQRLASLPKVWLFDGRAPARPATLQGFRIHLGQAILHFAGVNDISAAEKLRNLEVQVPFGTRTPLGPDRHYISDLVGCEVWEAAGGARLGTVQELRDTRDRGTDRMPELWLLVIGTPRGELMIPLATEICVLIDTAARRIEVRLPEGLRELNDGTL